ncbi:hypothetical protein KPH14_005002 [Odynerus spinipes]|uniref:Uncharacterized protein n=1 Tax=Odynerus spinipes TaxID=1348599 RepID=A0AAD9RN24_9HYME|nr:hypothetical protein KPH14_005002 [Odynerus spinipes]
MKLSLLTLTLLSSVCGNIWPLLETANIPSSTGAPIVDVRANSPTLQTLILPPRRDSIPLVPAPQSTFDKNEKIEPIVIDAIATPKLPNSAIILPQSRTPESASSRGSTMMTEVSDGNVNIAAIVRKDEIASDDTSKKVFLCGSLRDELIVSRPGSGSVFIKGASRVSIIDDAQNSVIVCPPSTNLSPPPVPEENAGTHGIDVDRKLTTLPPTAFISESPRTPASTDPPIELKDYLVPPYSYWQR